MSQSMSLTKFTAHLCERHSWRHCWGVGGWGAQTFREHSMSVGVLPSTRGMWHNKGWECSAALQPDETFLFFFCSFPHAPPASPALGRMPAACAKPESQACQGRRERRDPPELKVSTACQEKRCEEANCRNEGRSCVKSCNWSFFILFYFTAHTLRSQVNTASSTGGSRYQRSHGKPRKRRSQGRQRTLTTEA